MKYFLLLLPLLFCSCSYHATKDTSDTVVSLQLVGRDGMTETISNKERLKIYAPVDFLSSQPYQKVLRVYGRNPMGGVPSKITAYHSNGQVWQYLEILDGRAHGMFKEWYPNGSKKLEASLMEGTPDLTDLAKMGWVFDGEATVFDDQNHLIALIYYDQGVLHSTSLYFYPNGELEKLLPYNQGLLDGVCVTYSQEGKILERIPYTQGQRQGIAKAFSQIGTLIYEEEYLEDLLQNATYYIKEKQIAQVVNGEGKKALFSGEKLERLISIHQGKEEGLIEIFHPNGTLLSSYHELNGKKTGEEIEYYPHSKKPKISLSWYEDALQGQIKTWYEQGPIESQREFHQNKKQGMSFAWYKNGDLLCAEEYENDRLVKGSYFKKGDKNPVSKVENGKGIVTLYNGEGMFLRKTSYEKGMPIKE